MRPTVTWSITVYAVLMLSASAPPKPPWAWTVEERLAARFDEKARNQRIEAFEQQQAVWIAQRRAAPAAVISHSRPTDVVHGSDHPELLLPFEIFNVFVRAAYGYDDATAAVVRDDATRKAVPLGLPHNFLTLLQKDAQTFITLQREEMQLRERFASGNSDEARATKARLDVVEVLACSSRAAAIRALRQKFGSRFDRFLYSAIAPSVFRDLYTPVSPETLRRKEEGCR